MAVINCKNCGGSIELSADKTFGTCEFCGSTMTFPKVDDDQRAAAFNRGNHFRRIGEFDKALSVYERIVAEDDTDAEAHWCCALCRFGIEYVEDPGTFEWLPTCHRASFDSFLEDVDYKAAVEHSDGITRRQYQKDAAKIAEVQKGILATSQNAEPYDVFICYKESDENGGRTKDSTLAQEIYYQLTEQGRRVFFARITLEDVVGSQYEPYIFAALNSAKVMIVVGTKPEYLNAVWVKNEWSRFLAMMKKDRNKLLLPCYRDMDPYDLPEQLSVLQSYDMGKIGFIQDLIRGVSKVLDAGKQPARQETVVVQQSGGTNANALLKRGNMALEDGEWTKADEFFEEVLNQDAECAEAYIGKALVAERCANLQKFAEKRIQANSTHVQRKKLYLEANNDHIKSMVKKYRLPDYLDEQTVADLYDYDLSYGSTVESCKSMRSNEQSYWEKHRQLVRAERFAKGETAAQLAAAKKQVFDTLDRYISGATEQELDNCKKAEEAYAAFLARADEKAAALHADAQQRKYDKYLNQCQTLEDNDHIPTLRRAAEIFDHFGDYKDSPAKAAACREKIKRLEEEKARLAAEADAKAKAEAERVQREQAKAAAAKKKKDTITAVIVGVVIVAIIAVALVFANVIMPAQNYKKAEAHFAAGEYEQAIELFATKVNYKDSAQRIVVAAEKLAEETGDIQQQAIYYGIAGNYDEAALQKSLELWSQLRVHKTFDAGEHHTVALRSDGTVVSTVQKSEYNNGEHNVEEFRDIIEVAAGENHTVGLRADGTVVSTTYTGHSYFKDNAGEYYSEDYGQTNVEGWTDIVAIAAAGDYTIGVKADGTVVCTGKDALGVANWTNIVAVDIYSRHAVGLRADGTVVVAGNTQDGRGDVSKWENIVDVAAGYYQTVGLKADGTVVAVGYNQEGCCDVAVWTDIVDISAGYNFTVGVKADGTAVAVGESGYKINVGIDDGNDDEVALEEGKIDVVPEPAWSNLVAISAGYYHTVGQKANGTLVVTKNPENLMDKGQYDIGEWSGIRLTGSAAMVAQQETLYEETYQQGKQLMAAGKYGEAMDLFISIKNYQDSATLAEECFGGIDYLKAEELLAQGDVAAAAIAFGKLGDVLNARERSFELWDQVRKYNTISASYQYTAVVCPDNTVKAYGDDLSAYHEIYEWTDIVEIANTDGMTILGLKADGTVVAEGANAFGEGNVSDWTDVVSIASSAHHTVGLKADGTVYATGSNAWGQLEVQEWTDIVAIAANSEHTVGLKMDGTVVVAGWKNTGHNEGYGYDVDEWTDIVAIATGSSGTMGLRSDGTAVYEGVNDHFNDIAAEYNDIVAIDGSPNAFLLLGADQTVHYVGVSGVAYTYAVDQWENIVAVNAGYNHAVAIDADGHLYHGGSNLGEIPSDLTVKIPE